MTGGERTSLGLIGLAFVSRIFGTYPLYAKLGYALAGFHTLRGAAAGADSVTDALSPVGGGSPVGQLHFQARKARTIEQRVAYIHQQMLAGTRSPKVYGLARKVVTQKSGTGWVIPEKDAKAECQAMFFEVKRRVRYTWDPVNYDAFQTPQKTLELQSGDCDDACALLGAMLMSIGHPVSTRIVHTKGFPSWNHIYLRAQLPDKTWMPLDTTVNYPPGWEVPRDAMVRPPLDFDVRG